MDRQRLIPILSILIIWSGLLIAFMMGDSAFAQTATPAPTVPTPTLLPTNRLPLPPTVSGVVVDVDGPVAGATVEVQGQAAKIQTANDGSFTINGISGTT